MTAGGTGCRRCAPRWAAHYLTRPDNVHAKAGNINNALLHFATCPQPPDFVAILDADFVPMANFLDAHAGAVS